jgi:hypothetical protein
MVCPEFNSPVYELKRQTLGYTFSALQLGVQRGASTGAMPNVPKAIADTPYQCGSLKKRKTCEWCPCPGFPSFDQDVTFLCHGLYTPIKAHGLGFTKINLGHTLGYQLGVHLDILKGWVWCILLFLFNGD